MIREVRYIPYDEQDTYREAGWTVRPFDHAPHHRQYSLIASREVKSMKTLDVILRITALIAVTILFIAPGTILLIACAVLGLATLATAAIAGGLFCLASKAMKEG